MLQVKPGQEFRGTRHRAWWWLLMNHSARGRLEVDGLRDQRDTVTPSTINAHIAILVAHVRQLEEPHLARHVSLAPTPLRLHDHRVNRGKRGADTRGFMREPFCMRCDLRVLLGKWPEQRL